MRALFLILLTACAAEPPLRSRPEFARDIARVKKGMTTDEVRAILGPPDDVRSEADYGDRIWLTTPLVWCWGTSGHMTTVTLGAVHFGPDSRVAFDPRGRPGEPARPLPEERELRRLLSILDRVPSYDDWGAYTAGPVIAAVNALHPLGAETALSVLEEYLRVTPRYLRGPGPDGVFLVLRVLFEVPEEPGHLPRMYVGYCTEEPEDPTLFPRFPIALEGDIPFLIAKGYSGSGMPESPWKHLQWYRKEGVLRAAQLSPTTRPFEAVARIEKKVAHLEPKKKGCPDPQQAAGAALGLLRSVFRPPPNLKLPEILKLDAELDRLRIHWDPAANRYAFADGSVLPAEGTKDHPLMEWKLQALGTELRATFYRHDAQYVFVHGEWIQPDAAALPVTRLRFFRPEDPKSTLAEIAIGDLAQDFDCCSGGRRDTGIHYIVTRVVPLEEGREIQAEILTHRSPVYIP